MVNVAVPLVIVWLVLCAHLGPRQQEERRESKMVSVRWVPDLILYLDCLEVSLEECEDVCVCVCMKNI